MAELTATPVSTGRLTLARNQLQAVALLRWRIFANALGRKGGIGDLIGRILLAPFVLVLVFTPAVAAGIFAAAFTDANTLQRTSVIFWGAFLLAQLLNINLGQPGTAFDPLELIRFPITPRIYVLIRLAFGLLSPANIVIALISFAVFLGIVLRRPYLWPMALVATFVFALANVLFTRMVFAWVDRWLSTRRAREVFTALIFICSIGFQYLNVNYNPGFNRGRHRELASSAGIAHAQQLYQHGEPWLRLLPPELTASSLNAAAHGHTGQALGLSGAVLLYAAAFLLIYAVRMQIEYRGENLSDQANGVRTPSPTTGHSSPHSSATGPAFGTTANVGSASRPSATAAHAVGLAMPEGAQVWTQIAALLGKDLLLLRRNTGLLYGLLAPTVMVFLFAGRLSLHGGSHWLLPLAIAYALLGLAPMSYNSFGLEGTGAQFYFMAPLHLRHVFLAKNLLHFLVAAFELLTVTLIIAYLTGPPHPAQVLFCLLWAIGALLLNTTVGNLRSVAAPKKVNPGRNLNRNQSQLSVWMAIGLLMASAGFGMGFLLLADRLHQPWIAPALAALFAAGGLLAYRAGLQDIERYTLQHRDTLFEELGKKT